MSNLIPGEIIPEQGEIELNLGKEVKTVKVSNSGDRPVQIGSHYHFFEANKALIFDRELTLGMRLDIPAGQIQSKPCLPPGRKAVASAKRLLTLNPWRRWWRTSAIASCSGRVDRA